MGVKRVLVATTLWLRFLLKARFFIGRLQAQLIAKDAGFNLFDFAIT